MLNLNLVSQDLKKDIKIRFFYNIIKKFVYILLVLITFFAIAILFAKLILQNNFNNVVEQTSLITKNTKDSNSKIKEINTYINNGIAVQEEFTAWTYLLEDLSETLNNNIDIYFLEIDKDNNEFKLKGTAKEREDLIDFKSNLEKSNMFVNLDFPMKNILEKSNINFEIQASLALD